MNSRKVAIHSTNNAQKPIFILGISCFYHDSAVCLIKDGLVVAAAQEERFSRVKHDNTFPSKALEWVLQSEGLSMQEISVVTFYEKPLQKLDRIFNQHLEHFPWSFPTFLNTAGGWLTHKLNIRHILQTDWHFQGQIWFVPHHMAHAASSYYLSGSKEATIVTIDGVGEWATTTIGFGKGTDISIDREIHFPHSLGLLYSAITAYLGFKVNSDEYKVMGLSAYGDAKRYLPLFRQLLRQKADGSFQLNRRFFAYEYAERMLTPELVHLFGHPARKSSEPVMQFHANVAAALQRTLEEAVVTLLKAAHQQFPSDTLCMAGGVALNSLLNGKILKQTPYKTLFIPPDPGDGGGAMGAALWAWVHHSGKLPDTKSFHPYLGPGYQDYEIAHFLKQASLKHPELTVRHFLQEKKLLDTCVSLLQKQAVIGWFQGRMEWGPRALGNRSIIASAATREMKQLINTKIKKREEFRPFAPVVPESMAMQYFMVDKPLPIPARWMLMVYPFTAKGAQLAPATVHADFTGRLQTVRQEDNPKYFNLLWEYYRKTKSAILINTSFNVQEPIVCTPEDALHCFLKTELDAMVIGNFVVTKKSSNATQTKRK